MPALTVVTWNLFGLEERHLDERTEAACFHLLMERPPDVLLFQEVVDRSLRKAVPMIGISPSSGIFDLLVSTFSCVRPPITKVSPSLTEALVSASRWLIVGYPWLNPVTDDTTP